MDVILPVLTLLLLVGLAAFVVWQGREERRETNETMRRVVESLTTAMATVAATPRPLDFASDPAGSVILPPESPEERIRIVGDHVAQAEREATEKRRQAIHAGAQQIVASYQEKGLTISAEDAAEQAARMLDGLPPIPGLAGATA
jgi:hypothetical protein